MKCKWLFLLAALASSVCFAGEDQGRLYEYEVVRVIDGDTVVFEADFRPKPLEQKLGLRLKDINTPEISWRADCEQEKELGLEAKKFVENKIENADQILVKIVSTGAFSNRVVGDLILDGKNLTQMLLDQNYAKSIENPNYQNWCNENQ